MPWPTKKLGEIAEYINGRAFKPEEWGEGGLPIIRIQNLTETQEKFNHFDGVVDERNLIRNGDILLSWSASLGVYVWDKGDAVLNQHIFKVLPKKDIDKSFLFYALIIAVEELKRRVHGSTMTHVTKPVFNRVTVKIPPLEIQKQIVGRLDKIAEAQKLNDGLIQRTDELFQSLLNQGLNPASKSWELKKIGDVAEVIMGQSPLSSTYNERGDGLPFFQGKAEFGEIYPTPVKYCTSPSRIAEVNDILMSVRAPVGDINIAKEKSCIGRGLGALRAKKGVLNQMFLFYVMKKNENNWSRLSTGSTFSAIKGSNLKNFEIPIPALKTQEQIVAKLSAVQNYKKQLLEQKTKLKELFDSALHKSMAQRPR